MRKTITLFFLMCLGVAHAQNCAPDPQYVQEGPGVYPDSLVGLPPAYACQPYSAVITVVVPYDTVVDFGSGPDTTIIDSVVLKTVDDLPPNFSYACEPPSCSWVGGTAGCIVLTGFPDPADTGEYVPVGNVFGYVDAFPGFGLVFPKIDYYTIDINPGGGPVNASIVNSVPVSCSGGCNGALTAEANCGFPPYAYAWSNGQATQTATGLCAGNYSVTVSDSAGSAIVNFTLSEPAPLSLSFTQADPTNGCNGSITVNTSGGTSPYSYKWTTGDTTKTIDSLCGGFYQVTVTDANNCPPAVNAVFLMVGMNESLSGSAVTVYPNPGSGKFFIEGLNGNNAAIISVVDLLGKTVFKAVPGEKKHEIDLSHLAGGQYVLRISAGKERISRRIVIIR